MGDKDKVISFEHEFNKIDDRLDVAERQSDVADNDISAVSDELKVLFDELGEVPGAFCIVETQLDLDSIDDLDKRINEIIDPYFCGSIKLTATDVIVSVVAGAIVAAIDIILVGTPEVVKIYKGGENFNGSVSTKALRNIGNGDDKFSALLDWFCEKCKVPYDISVAKDVVIPDNHRLRNFAHDPLMGMLFAMADIIMRTATLVDNNGHLRILVNPRDYPSRSCPVRLALNRDVELKPL